MTESGLPEARSRDPRRATGSTPVDRSISQLRSRAAATDNSPPHDHLAALAVITAAVFGVVLNLGLTSCSTK